MTTKVYKFMSIDTAMYLLRSNAKAFLKLEYYKKNK